MNSTAVFRSDETTDIFRRALKKSTQIDDDDDDADPEDSALTIHRTGSEDTAKTWCVIETSFSFDSADDEEYISVKGLNIQELSHEDSIEVVECPVCFSTIPSSSALILQNCNHAFCIPCFRQCVTVQVENGNAANVRCPMPIKECGKCIHPSDLHDALGSKAYEKLDGYALQSALTSDRIFHHCITPDCPCVVFTDECNDPTKFVCEVCEQSCCLSCKVSPYHEGKTCTQHKKKTKKKRLHIPCFFFQKRKKKSLLQEVNVPNCTKKNTKKQKKSSEEEEEKMEIKSCKNCGAQIIKESGCNKIKCRCGYKFCYICDCENATCGHTSDKHGFIDNVTGRAEFPSSDRYRKKFSWLEVLLYPQGTI